MNPDVFGYHMHQMGTLQNYWMCHTMARHPRAWFYISSINQTCRSIWCRRHPLFRDSRREIYSGMYRFAIYDVDMKERQFDTRRLTNHDGLSNILERDRNDEYCCREKLVAPLTHQHIDLRQRLPGVTPLGNVCQIQEAIYNIQGPHQQKGRTVFHIRDASVGLSYYEKSKLQQAFPERARGGKMGK